MSDRHGALRALYLALVDLGADAAATDAARVLRLAGTLNSKNGATVRLTEYRAPGVPGALRYELADLARQYLPAEWQTSARGPKVREGTPPARRRKSAPAWLRTPYSLHMARLADLRRLGELRGWDCRGHREQMVFLWRYWSCCVLSDAQEALRQAQEFNAQFKEPLGEREVISATRSAEKAWEAWKRWVAAGSPPTKRGDPPSGYNYSNERLVEVLGITAEEQRRLQTIIATAERYRRWNEKRWKGRWHQMPMEDRVGQFQAARAAHPGASQRELARVLGWSRDTVQRCICDLRAAAPEGGRFGA